MPELEVLKRLAVALAIGLLVGLERGWRSREEAEGERTAGLRTYALSGLLGGVAGLLTADNHVALAVIFVAFTATFAAFQWRELSAAGTYSVTSVVAAMLTFVVGAYAVLGVPHIAVAIAVAMTLLLALKQPLHRWLRRLTWPEIRATLTLLAMSFLLLPVLPDRPLDPWGALNPAEIWLLAIIIAGVSFAGYAAVRIMGDQAGVALAGLAGGLASSTAATLAFARMARQQPAAAPLLAGGILLAGIVMLVRVIAIAGALNAALIVPLLWPLGAGAVIFGLPCLVIFGRLRDGAGAPTQLAMRNPFELGTVLKLAGFIAILMLVARIVVDRLGEQALLVVAMISGLADVDALTLSLSRMSHDGISPATAVAGIALTAGVNTLVKAVLAAVAGTLRTGVIVGATSLAAIAAGSAVWYLAPL
ncbi:MAG: MgtC/SapB family protein [Alphaproteobacteria bacterium]|nr:MgtC/SapB family protein [Alphaproteobacteria bacterium]